MSRALVLRVQGLRAFYNLGRIWRLFARGKIKPVKTLFSIKTSAAEAAGRILAKGAPKR
jgi:hypothetical protein